MIKNIFEPPVSANAAGFLIQMKIIVAEYKKIMVQSDNIFRKLRTIYTKNRFNSLMKCKKNFRFNAAEQSEYADLVFQYNNSNTINYIDDTIFNDTKESLLGESY
jgi:N-acetyl-gamma-glutamylphosphate reductase